MALPKTYQRGCHPNLRELSKPPALRHWLVFFRRNPTIKLYSGTRFQMPSTPSSRSYSCSVSFDFYQLYFKTVSNTTLPTVVSRSVSPNDLISMAEYLCGSLEHLDLVGNALVTESCVTRLLAKCVKLTFLDISHCTSISLADVMALRTAYTNCAIASNHHTFIPPPFPGPPVNFFLQSLTSSRAQPALFLPPPTSPPPPSPPQENQEFNP